VTRRTIGWLLAGAALSLGACGGGGGGGGPRPNLNPPPAPTPTPSPTPTPAPGPSGAAVTIFPNPVPGEYAVVGASIAGSGGNLDTYESSSARFGPVSSADSDQMHIRYSSAGYYEIQMPGGSWDRLVHYKGLADPTSENNYFQPASVPQNYGHLAIANAAKWSGYSYSEMGSWGSQAAGRYGAVAFGVPTPAGAVPVTGSATFNGRVMGNADIMQAHGLYGGYVPMAVDGTVTLAFDFAGGTLSGGMSLYGSDGWDSFLLGNFAFKDTVFSVGSTTYSGKFETSSAGDNFFLGRFTGPNAQETIGAWAVPFVFNSGNTAVPPDGQVHQAYGAWIAKR